MKEINFKVVKMDTFLVLTFLDLKLMFRDTAPAYFNIQPFINALYQLPLLTTMYIDNYKSKVQFKLSYSKVKQSHCTP
jgi:hypothetical protein